VDAEESGFKMSLTTWPTLPWKNIIKGAAWSIIHLQMYHMTLGRTKESNEVAKDRDMSLGQKQFVAAYMRERDRRLSGMSYPSPIQPNKAATDRIMHLAIELRTGKWRVFGFRVHNDSS